MKGQMKVMKSIMSVLFALCLLMQSSVAQQFSVADSWRFVSSRPAGEILKVKLNDGSTVKGTLKNADDTGLVLEHKSKEVKVGREEITSVAVASKKSVAKSTLIGMAVGGGVGAGAGAGFGASQNGNFILTRGQTAALGAGIFGGIGAVAGSLIGFATGRSGHRETLIYQASEAQ